MRVGAVEQGTAWAYKFCIFEVSSKLARDAWRHRRLSGDELTWDHVRETSAPNRASSRAPRTVRRPLLRIQAQSQRERSTNPERSRGLRGSAPRARRSRRALTTSPRPVR